MRKLAIGIAPLYTAFIVYMSLGDNSMPHIEVTHIDKVYHATAYFVMFLLWYLFFNKKAVVQHSFQFKNCLAQFVLWDRIAVTRSAAASLMIGALLELGQGYFSENRTMDVLDMIANSSGIILAILFLWIWSQKLNADIS